MLKLGEVPHDERTRGAGGQFHPAMGGCARRMALAGLVAGSLLLATPALAAKPGPVASPAATPAAQNPKVSAHVIANRQRAEAAAGEREHSTKHTPGQSPPKAKPARARRH